MLKNITIMIDNSTYMNKDYAITFKNPEALNRLLQDINEEITARNLIEEEMVIDILTLKIICYKIIEPIPLFTALTFDDSTKPEKVFQKMHEFIKFVINVVEKKKLLFQKVRIFHLKKLHL